MGDFRTFFPKECPVVFKVRNIADGNKRIKLFNTPIKNGCVRDLLAIPSVSEDVIRHSLLKGDLHQKLKAKEIIVTESNIELLQFNDCHMQFLISSGITIGVDPGIIGGGGDGYSISSLPFAFKQGISLIGNQNGSNISFYTPDKFINGNYSNNTFKIRVIKNGRILVENEDYELFESGGVGTGWDTVRFLCTPPYPDDFIEVDYVIPVSGSNNDNDGYGGYVEKEVFYDITIDYVYVGTAPLDSLKNNPVWRIERFEFDAGGIFINKMASDYNVVWDDRYIVNYY